MKAEFYNVTIVRDAHFHIPRQASGWELPILQEIFGEGAVEVGDSFVRDIPEVDVRSEHARLSRLYKHEEESKVPFVEIVYGRGPAGLKQLEKAIANSMVGEERRGPGRPKKDVEAA